MAAFFFVFTNKGNDDYGGPGNASCPVTLSPTIDPTIDPTIQPTIAPTMDPTVNPTINSKLKQIEIEIDIINSGVGTTATITVFWDTDQYVCKINPLFNDDTNKYLCNNNTNKWSRKTIIAEEYVQYYVKIEFNQSSEALQISGINITDIDDDWYFIDYFCIR